jgi:hypothetical protein
MKQHSLLGNGYETNNTTSVAGQQILNKQKLNSKIETVFSVQSMPTGYELDKV